MKREKLNSGWINTIQESISTAKTQAAINGTEVEFDFNGINVIVSADTNTSLLLRDYFNAHLMGWNEIGPNPLTEYSDDVLMEIDSAKEQQRKKEEDRFAAYKKEQDAKQEAFNKEVEGITIELKDEEIWKDFVDKNQDPYGKGCVVFAENWAKLMQKHMSEGISLQNCASADSHLADTDGITGFMYGAAVHMLALCWKHGEELRKWHNKDYGQPDAEGTINPAVITVAIKD